MRFGSWKAAAVPAVIAVLSAARPAGADEGLSLRRALLSSGGVGYFEYEAEVHGAADLPLAVPLDQVDDVLKSVVVYDTRGRVGSITLPGKDPLDRAFRDLPFDASALASEPALLEALRGAEVRVTTADGTIDGRVLSVTPESIALPNGGGTVTRNRLALEAGGTVTSVILEDVSSLSFVDRTLKAQIDAALAATVDQNERGKRTLLVHSEGEGDRVVRVGYVVAVPLWKGTYRLTLPADRAAKTADLQGWAVLENQTGADWKGVDLTLVSGNPVTFRQALYASYYVDRPEVPVEVVGRILPAPDTGTVPVPEPVPAMAPSFAPRGMGRSFPGMAAPSADHAPAPAAVTPAEATEDVAQVVFHLPSPVSLADGKQALIPVIEREIGASRVALYDPDTDARHPLASVELANTGATSLPPGVITTYERAPGGTVTYVGDARLSTLPAGERRFVSFGVDPKVTVDRNVGQRRVLDEATLEGGVLQITRKEQQVTDYTITAAAGEARTVVLEHARVPGFDLASPRDALLGVTDHDYRLRVDVPAGKTVPVEVVLERPVSTRIAVSSLSSADLAAYVGASSDLPAPLRAALGRVAALRRAADEKEVAVKDLVAERDRITADQGRIRDNLKAVPAGGDLAKRYLDMLSHEEDRIAAIEADLATARTAAAQAEKALADLIRSLHERA